MELIQTATKRQEVWRKPDGTFGKAPAPTPEAKPETKKEDGGVIVGTTLISGSFLFLAIVFWKVTLSVAAGGGIVYLAQKYIKERQSREALKVNQGGQSTVIYL